MPANLNLPLEQLLVAGGDSRLIVNAATGRNRYGCSPLPQDVIPFGSCTSSSISSRGFAAAFRCQQQLLAGPDPAAIAVQCSNTIRHRLRVLLTLDGGTDVALGPSGTDVELLALALAAGDSNRPIVNIVVGPTEVGSGTLLAAACRHYDARTPDGQDVVSGEPVDTALASRVTVETVDLRTPDGAMLHESEIDAAVTDLVVRASENGAIVLLHVVAHSKTGVHAPSLSCAERLRTACENVTVVVDAAQGRVSRRGLRDALAKGFLVIFTGSKFYGGPPFSGALLVPRELQPSRRRLRELPAGFGAYFTAAELPETWAPVCGSLPGEPNYGAILRWEAALVEIAAYYDVPDGARLGVLRFFESEAPSILGSSNSIKMLPAFPPLHEDNVERLLESKTTVVGFWVTPPNGQRTIGQQGLKSLHADLIEDVFDRCGAAEREILSRAYHIGQPVNLGRGGHILRVALGGPLIIRVAQDESIGQSFAQRLKWLRNELIGLREKIDCLAARHAAAGLSPAAFGHSAGSDLTQLPIPDASV